MARSTHSTYTAADRHERRALRRQKRPATRRTGTRFGMLALAMQEG